MLVLVYRKCSTCLKALKWLEENGIEFVKSRTGERREIMIVYSPNDDMTIKNFSSQNDCKNPQSVS